MRKKITAVFCVALIAVSMFSACGKKPRIVENYPVDKQSDVITVVGDDATAPDELTDDDVILDDVRYDPTRLNFVYADTVNDNVKSQAIALLTAIDQCKESVEFDSSLDVSNNTVNLALNIAMLSNPIAECVSIGTSDGYVYELQYVYEQIKMQEIRDKYVEEVEAALTACVTTGQSKAESARNLYKYEVEHFLIDVDNEFYEILGNDASGEKVEGTFTEEAVGNGKGGVFNINYYMLGLMTQIGVGTELIGSYGESIYDGSSATLKKIGEEYNQTIFSAIFIGEDPYFCDITFDGLMYYEQLIDFPDSECEIQFFGMSDETRNKTWKQYYTSSLYNPVPSKSLPIPKCPNDL